MKTYNYKAPFVKASTIQIDICDSESYSIGNIKRYYKTVFHWFFDMWVGEYKFFSNFRAVDSNGEKVIEAFKKNYIMKPSEYQFSFLHGPYKGLILTAIQDGFSKIHFLAFSYAAMTRSTYSGCSFANCSRTFKKPYVFKSAFR